PSWKREGAKSVDAVTNLSGDKDIRAYSIPGFEDIPVIVAKDKNGWRAAIAAAGLEMNLDIGHPTADIAAFAAQERMSRAGKEKLVALVERAIEANRRQEPMAQMPSEYGGAHRPSEEGPPAHDMLEGGMAPDDIYGKDAPRYYGEAN